MGTKVDEKPRFSKRVRMKKVFLQRKDTSIILVSQEVSLKSFAKVVDFAQII
jgi:hypothetical protein